jgi:hypothetical protein
VKRAHPGLWGVGRRAILASVAFWVLTIGGALAVQVWLSAAGSGSAGREDGPGARLRADLAAYRAVGAAEGTGD